MQPATDETIIPFNRKKIALSMGLMAFAIYLCFWDLSSDNRVSMHVRYSVYSFIETNPALHYALDIGGIIFCFLVVCIAFRMFWDKQPALVLNADGIIDNSSASAVGFIPWADIQAFEVSSVMFSKIVLVKLRNASHYTNRGNRLKRLWLKLGRVLTGTPVSISSHLLTITLRDLLVLCNEYHAKYKQTIPL